MNANDILQQASHEIHDRATKYDDKKGERSIPKTVVMFNALTGHKLTEEQGWKFMCCLKLVRSEQGTHKNDNYVDGAAYFALAGELEDEGEDELVTSTIDAVELLGTAMEPPILHPPPGVLT